MEIIDTYKIIGFGTYLLLLVFHNSLKNTTVYLIILTATILIAGFGWMNLEDSTLKMPRGSVASSLFIPLLFMLYYKFLKILFAKIFGQEHIMTRYMSWGPTQGEYRKSHLGDGIFTGLIIVLPILTLVLLQ